MTREGPIDFGVKRSKVKVIFGLSTFFMSEGGPLLGVKRLELNWETLNLLPRGVCGGVFVPFRTGFIVFKLLLVIIYK